MLSEIQLQKLINKGMTYIFISKENEGYVMNTLTTVGWSSEEIKTENQLADVINMWKYQPDVLIDTYSDINI